MGKKQVLCPHCTKKRRLLDVFACEKNTVLEIKCPQCGNIWKITVDGDKISMARSV